MIKTAQQLIDEANAQVEQIAPTEADALLGTPGVLFVDLRDIRELWREGTIAGAISAPRGMLEFWIDPESPYHKDLFAKDQKFVFFCGGGWRSALAARTAHEMGIGPVAHMAGGWAEWKKADGAIEEA